MISASTWVQRLGDTRSLRRWIPVASLLVLALAYLPTVYSFSITWGRYNYAHGWLVPALVAWLFWSDRGAFAGRRGGDPLLLVPIVILSLFWLLSIITGIQQFHQTAFVLILCLWGLYAYGRRAARTILASTVVALLSLPIWEGSQMILRRITTVASVLMVRAVGISAEIDGTLIHLSVGSFQVADDCSGLNYLLAALVIGITYAQVLQRRNRLRIITVAIAASLAIVSNWIRVAVIVFVGQLTAMEGWLVGNHIWFGWVVFAVALIVFFLLIGRLEKRMDTAPATTGDQPGMAASDGAGPSGGGNGGGAALPARAALATAFALTGPLVFFTVSAIPAAAAPDHGLERMTRGAAWELAPQGSERVVDWHPDYSGADRHDRLVFTDGERQVYGERFLYMDQEPGAELVGWPNRIAMPDDVLADEVVGPVDVDGSLWVRQAVVRTEDRPMLVWYWYRVGGTPTFTRLQAKALEIPGFFFRREAAELIALSTPCEPRSCEQAFGTLADFLGLDPPSEAGS